MSIKENLIKARAVIADPSNWMQGDYSNDDQTCFCAIGAIAKAKGVSNGSAVCSPEELHLRSVASDGIAVFDPNPESSFAIYNDNYSHAEVLAIFDKAIELAQD